ncbi:MAG TPA: S49 family peptidase [Oligoflexus sp.]|uniref:S49 family peptidase n=1 Tax=Oligoflexus sp. TaxID=1971216 RepID=UPI002D6ACD13|nr:S49 family peptidase [Oligoflexus sp.]HYX34772.1 S49 family peptidase [Oligoflexus sp.]
MSLLLNYILGSHWSMTNEALRSMISVVERHAGNQALEKVQGQKPLGSEKAAIRNGVAIIPVRGPLFKRANLMTTHCGASSYETILKDLHRMLLTPEVKSILLDIDSPGGEANGCSELADAIFSARGQKPIFAYVGGTGASAAYWIASACEKVFAADSAIVGSIGVQSIMQSSAQDGQLRFISSQSPNKNLDPATEEGAREVQGVVDSLAEIFVGKVALYRGISRAQVLEHYGQGSVFVGQQAQRRGLIDVISNFEEVIMDIQTEENPLGENSVTVDFITKHHPEIGAHFEEAGRESGRQAERERVAGIHRLTTAGVDPSLIQQLISEGVSVESAAVRILQDISKSRCALVSGFAAAEDKIKGLSSGTTSLSPEDELDADLRLAVAHGIRTR